MTLESTIGFQAQARPIELRHRFRNDIPCLINVDPRVYRGSTVRRPQPTQLEPEPPKRPFKKIFKKSRELDHPPPTFPIAPPPRIDLAVETAKMLAEHVIPILMLEVDTQTDQFINRPRTPPFIPQKNGIDVEIQVVEEDLFNFDYEVKPIVRLIVSKILEQSLYEVRMEAEFEGIKKAREAILKAREEELARVRALEKAEKRKYLDKEKQLLAGRQRREKEMSLKDKITARGFAEYYVNDMYDGVMRVLQSHGYFYDEIERMVELEFLPWLSEGVEEARKIEKIEFQIERVIAETVIEAEKMDREVFKSEVEARDVEEKAQREVMMRMMVIEDIAARKIQSIYLEIKKQKEESEQQHEEESNE